MQSSAKHNGNDDKKHATAEAPVPTRAYTKNTLSEKMLHAPQDQDQGANKKKKNGKMPKSASTSTLETEAHTFFTANRTEISNSERLSEARNRWKMLIRFALAYGCSMGADINPFLAFPTYVLSEVMNRRDGKASWQFALFDWGTSTTLFGIVFLPIALLLSRRISFRNLVRTAMISSFISSALLPVAFLLPERTATFFQLAGLIGSFSYSVFCLTPAAFVGIWFPSNERPIATSIVFTTKMVVILLYYASNGVLFRLLGDDIHARVRLYTSIGVFISFIGLISLIGFQNKPEFPPSASQLQRYRVKTRLGVFRLLKTNKTVRWGWMLFVSAYVSSNLLRRFAANLFHSTGQFSQMFIIWIINVGGFGGLIGTGLCVFLMHRSQNASGYRDFITVASAIAAGSFIWIAGGFVPDNYISLMFAFTLNGSASLSLLPAFYEAMAETSYPEPETTTAAILMWPAMLSHAAVSVVTSFVGFSINMLFGLAGLASIGAVGAYFKFKPELKRWKVDNPMQHVVNEEWEGNNAAEPEKLTCLEFFGRKKPVKWGQVLDESADTTAKLKRRRSKPKFSTQINRPARDSNSKQRKDPGHTSRCRSDMSSMPESSLLGESVAIDVYEIDNLKE